MNAYAPVDAMDERKAMRSAVSVAVDLHRQHYPPEAAVMSDVSASGCRLRTEARISVGSFVTVTIPGLTDIGGWIAWHRGDEIGIDFTHEVPSPVADGIIRIGC